jgi:hypothetical protein
MTDQELKSLAAKAVAQSVRGGYQDSLPLEAVSMKALTGAVDKMRSIGDSRADVYLAHAKNRTVC